MSARRSPFPGLFLAALVACSSEPLGTEGQSCGNDQACASGLRCISGFCRTPNRQADAGPNPADGGTPDAGPPGDQETLASGVVQNLADGTARGLTIRGSAFMSRGTDDRTSVRIRATGLMANTMYPAHVHNQSCATGGGDHYKIDEGIAAVEEANEIWPAVTTGPDGVGYGYRTVLHRARTDARSVVVHDPADGARLACVDLEPAPMVIMTGTFEALPDGALLNLTGTAEIVRRNGGGTELSVSLSGTLVATTVYPTHLHDRPCDDDAGGAHYKIDPNVSGTVESNELWPMIMTDAAGGTGTGMVTSATHIARGEAWSVVVHDPDTNARLACAHLR